MDTVPISIYTARHALACIQTQASDNIRRVKDVAHEVAVRGPFGLDPKQLDWIKEATLIIHQLDTAQTDLRRAIDSAEVTQ